MDINCDLGEGEPIVRTRALMRRVTSANIACGGHAGTEKSMQACLRLCREWNVRAGAHPGFADRENFGRIPQPILPRQLLVLLNTQVGDLARLARAEKVKLRQIKLHGALYHAVEKSRPLARAYVEYVKQYSPQLTIIAQAGGLVVKTARDKGVSVWGEVFADRGYSKNGRLIPRSEPGALIDDEARIRDRVESLRITGAFPETAKLDAQTICVHADSPGAVRIAGILAKAFR